MKKLKLTNDPCVSDRVDHTLEILASASPNMEDFCDDDPRWSSSVHDRSEKEDDSDMVVQVGSGTFWSCKDIAIGKDDKEDVVMINIRDRCTHKIALEKWISAYAPEVGNVDVHQYETYFEDKDKRPNLGCQDAHINQEAAKLFAPFLKKHKEKGGEWEISFDDTSGKGLWSGTEKPDVTGKRTTEDSRRMIENCLQRAADEDHKAAQFQNQINTLQNKIKDFHGTGRELPYRTMKIWHTRIQSLRRRKDKRKAISQLLKHTAAQFVFLLIEHTWQGKKEDLMEESYWVMTKCPPPLATVRSKLLQQQRCVAVVFKYQPFRQFMINILILNGWMYFCYQDRSSLAISEPLNINKPAHRRFIFQFFHVLIVEESPKLLGYVAYTEKIGIESFIWQFFPTSNSQWAIQLDVEKEDQGGIEKHRTVWHTITKDQRPPYILRDSTTGRNLFGSLVKKVEPVPSGEETRLFLKFEWTPVDIEAEIKSENVVLTCEIDHLRLHEELDLPGRLKIVASGKLHKTKSQIEGSESLTFENKESVREVAAAQSAHLCSLMEPPLLVQAKNRSKPYIQYRACVLITRYTKTFEQKIMDEPLSAYDAFAYWMFGALAHELTVFKSIGFIQGDISFANMRYNGDDLEGSDYSALTEVHTNIGDWDLAETSVREKRKDNVHSGTPVFMAYDCLDPEMNDDEVEFDKVLYHDLESMWWAGNMAIWRTLQARATEKAGVSQQHFVRLDDFSEIANEQSLAESADSVDDLPARDNDHKTLDCTDRLKKGRNIGFVNYMLDKYHGDCYRVYASMRKKFVTWDNLASFSADQLKQMADTKYLIQMMDRKAFRKTWPDSQVLESWNLPGVNKAIELMADIHVKLNCSLRQRVHSTDSLTLYERKRGKVSASSTEDLGVHVAEQILKLLEKYVRKGRATGLQSGQQSGQQIGQETGGTLFEQVKAWQTIVDGNKERAFLNFASKYPDLVRTAQ